MKFLLNLTAPNHAAVSYHEVVKSQMSPDMQALSIFVDSWPIQASREDGHVPVWHWHFLAPVDSLDFSGGMRGALTQAVLDSEWFSGASVLV